MSQTLKIISWEFINRVRTKLFLITTFILPFLMGGLMFLPSLLMDLEPENETIIGLVYDDDMDLLMKRFKERCDANFLTQDGLSQFRFINLNSPEAASDSLLKKGIDGFMMVPNSVVDSGKVSYYSQSLSNLKIYTTLRRTLSQLVIEQRMLNEKIDISLVSKLSRKIEFETYEINDKGETSEGDELASFVIPYLFLMILFMTVFMSGQLLLRSVIEERTSRTIEILLSTVTANQIMKGKILGLGLLGMVQMIFYLIVGLSITYYKNWATIEPMQIPFFLIYFITGYLFYAAIFACLGTFFTSEQEAQQSSGIISLIAILPMIFASYFITNPWSKFTIAVTYIPPLTPFMMIIRLGTGAVEMNEIVISAILMLISCWVLLKLSGRIFRTAILLYGKKITALEIWKWVRA